MPKTEGIFGDEPDKFKMACAMRRRHQLAEQRADSFAKTVYVRELNVWLLTYQGSRDSQRFRTLKRAQEDILMAQASRTREQGGRKIYKHLDYAPFDERVGYMRPVYALPRQPSTTAPREPR